MSSSRQISELSDSTVEADGLLIRFVSEPAGSHVSLVGELDLVNATRFEAELSRVFDVDAGTVTVDLSGLHFVDASGIHALMRLSERAQATGGTFRLVRGRGQVDRVMRLTNVVRTLPIID